MQLYQNLSYYLKYHYYFLPAKLFPDPYPGQRLIHTVAQKSQAKHLLPISITFVCIVALHLPLDNIRGLVIVRK